MVKAISTFMDLCYLVRRSVLDDNDVEQVTQLIEEFHQERTVFEQVGVRLDGFSLPRQHSLVHYPLLITEFGAPNGLCSSITESAHITSVKKPWHRSNRYNALSQMLLTNQRLDKLAASRVDFSTRGMLNEPLLTHDNFPPPPNDYNNNDDDDGGAIDTRNIIGEVKLVSKPSKCPNTMLLVPT
jgi:hypothetical protein